jgi:hypothetical protein
VFSLELRRDAKEGMNETLLPDHISLRQPPDLPFPDQSKRLRIRVIAAIRKELRID